MTSKISLFNKGIYKSTIKRYLWGSVLYFILLFMVTGMSILLSYNSANRYLPQRGENWSLIMSSEYIIIPMLLAIAVPTVAGLMIFRFIHSKKTSVFVHSLPVKREANYVSSVLAAFTLMGVPVIFNTIVLMIISMSGYWQYFDIGDCVVWMLFNLFAIFIMFSCVCFVASITGNSFAMIVLNVLFHSFVPMIVAGFEVITEKFLFGFANDGWLITKVVDKNFPVRLMSMATSYEYRPNGAYTIDIIIFFVAAVILYTVAGILYKKRRMETAEDVAGFKCLNPIFKYLLTFMGALAAFSIFSSSMSDSYTVFWCIIAIVSGVIYFGGEMLLRKTLRVWHTYKGYLGFAAAFFVMICIFAFTSFFGFETRIPEKKDISQIAVYDYYHMEKPYIDDGELISKTAVIHSNMLAKNETVKKQNHDTYIHIEYKLKNGNIVHRRYGISDDELHSIMETMYKTPEYKQKIERIYTAISSIYSMNIYAGEHIEIREETQKNELMECIKKDISELGYNEIHNNAWGFNIDIEYIPEKVINDNNYRIITSENGERERIYIEYMNVNINANFKNTISWIMENGYWDKIAIKNEGIMYICPDYTDLPFLEKNETTGEVNITGVISSVKEQNIIKLDTPEEIEKLINYAQFEKQTYVNKKDRLGVYQVYDTQKGNYRNVTVMSESDVMRLFPEKIKK